jgi:hypothetical protein
VGKPGTRQRLLFAGLRFPESLSCASPTKARWKGHGTEHCGFCLPCLIRRAVIKRGIQWADPTTYTLADLKAAPLNTSEAECTQVRSFQFAIARLLQKPHLASILIHKSGSLVDEDATRQNALADVYLRGMNEVGTLLKFVITRAQTEISCPRTTLISTVIWIFMKTSCRQ